MVKASTVSKTTKKSEKKPVEKKEKKPVEKKPVEKKVKKQKTEDEESGSENEKEVAVSEKKRRTVTRETILEEITDLISVVDAEILRIRESTDKKNKAKGIKTLRTVNKRLKALKTDSTRVMKQKTREKRVQNGASGFMKPVGISDNMAKFTGWAPNDLKSRVDVTKYICNYIRDNKLQNESDKRQIMPDKKLTDLLGYNTKTEPALTYYYLQKKIQPHFINNKTVAETPSKESTSKKPVKV